MDTPFATSAELAVEQTAILVPGRSAPPSGATSHEIDNMRLLQPGSMMDADTTSPSCSI